MKKFFIALQTLLYTVEGIKYVNKWKQQHNMVIDGTMELFQYPAVFIEFVNTTPTDDSSMGGGVQIYPIRFRLHILSWLLDSKDGDFEKNLEVYDLQESIYKKVNKFQPGLTDPTNLVGSCARTGYEEDYEWAHKGVTHLIQEWETQYVDCIAEEPVDGVDGPEPPLEMKVDLTVKDSEDPDAPHEYLFTPTA